MLSRFCLIKIIIIILTINSGYFGLSVKLKKQMIENSRFFKTQTQFKSLLEIDSNAFNKYVINYPRNFSLLIEFTVMKRQELCRYCEILHNEFIFLADNYKLSKQEGLYIVYVDYQKSPDPIVQMNVSYLPQYMFFEKMTKYTEYKTLPPVLVPSADMLAKSLRHVSGIKIDVRMKTNNNLKLITAMCLLIGLCLTKLKFIRKILSNRYFWAILTLTWIICFSSGVMFNMINKGHFTPPKEFSFSLSDIINPHSSSFSESAVVGAAYASCTLCIMAIYASNKLIKDHTYLKLGLELGLSFLLTLLISFMVKIFRMKNTHYGASLLL